MRAVERRTMNAIRRESDHKLCCSFCHNIPTFRDGSDTKIEYHRMKNLHNDTYTHIWVCEREECKDSMDSMLGKRTACRVFQLTTTVIFFSILFIYFFVQIVNKMTELVTK